MFQSLLAVLFIGMVPAQSALTQPVDFLNITIVPPLQKIVQIHERLSASGVIVMDPASGQILYAKQSEVRRPMASLTKLMTALVIAENHEMDEVVKIPLWADNVEGNVAYLPPGEHFTIRDLLSALLIASANDAARVLAIFHAGSSENFAGEMNERAQSLGLTSTSFANPSGLDHPNQYSTPRDIAWLATFALRNPEVAQRIRSRGQRIWSVEGTPIYLSHTHALLHSDTLVTAGKTGTTTAAGQCLFSLVEQNNQAYIVVLLQSLQRYTDMQTILHTIAPSSSVVADVSL
jgi:serine-type D-Ala-D-Ala carboxypeptidase (penicillin-binding protein 5/6)